MMEIRRSVMIGTPLVAPGYMKVEYIQNTSWAYVNTNYTPTKDDEIQCTYQINSLNGSMRCLLSAGTGTYQLIALANTASGKGAYYYCKYFASGGAKNLYSYNDSTDVWYTMTITSQGVFSDNNVSVTSQYEHELDGDNTSLYIFRRRNNENTFVGKLKEFKIFNGGNLKMNLVPCIRMTDDVAGVYDTVSKVFLTSAASGYTFIPGRTMY